jgi:hypothetical protein
MTQKRRDFWAISFVSAILEPRFFGNLEVLVLAKRRPFKSLKTEVLLQDTAFHLLIRRIGITLQLCTPRRNLVFSNLEARLLAKRRRFRS